MGTFRFPLFRHTRRLLGACAFALGAIAAAEVCAEDTVPINLRAWEIPPGTKLHFLRDVRVEPTQKYGLVIENNDMRCFIYVAETSFTPRILRAGERSFPVARTKQDLGVFYELSDEKNSVTTFACWTSVSLPLAWLVERLRSVVTFEFPEGIFKPKDL